MVTQISQMFYFMVTQISRISQIVQTTPNPSYLGGEKICGICEICVTYKKRMCDL